MLLSMKISNRPVADRRGSRRAGVSAPGSVARQSLPADALQGDLHVVLVAPKTASNVGAVARCAANFEATQLWVVAPRCDPQGEEARRVACGNASAILDAIKVVEDLAEALTVASGSIGFTRRAGATRTTHASIGHMLTAFPHAIPGMVPGCMPQGITALVFGREESGLTEEELRLCAHACAIPTGRIQGSLNLSHAVAVVLCELYQRRLAAQASLVGDSEPFVWSPPGLGSSGVVQGSAFTQAASEPGDQALQPATASELESLLRKVSDLCQAVGLSGEESRGGGNAGNHGRRRLPVGHVRALLGRARPLQGEVRSLHGLASKLLAEVDPNNPLASGRTPRGTPAAAILGQRPAVQSDSTECAA